MFPCRFSFNRAPIGNRAILFNKLEFVELFLVYIDEKDSKMF